MPSPIATPGRLKRRSEFYHQLASLSRAGLGTTESLENISPRSGFERRQIREVIDNLRSGATLEETIAEREAWLPAFDRMMIGAGEKSGRLEDVFHSLSTHYEERAQLFSSVLWRLAYPVFLLHVASLVLGIISITQSILTEKLGDGPAQEWSITGKFMPILLFWLVIYAVAIWIIFACQGSRGLAMRSMVEQFTSRIPVFGRALKELSLARLTSSLQVLLDAGVDFREAWSTAALASGSPRMQRRVKGWLPQLDSGLLPSEIISKQPEFPSVFRDLYRTGEISGQLDDSLKRLSRHYQEEGANRLKRAAAGATGIVYGAVVLIVAFVVISFWAGYYGQLLG